MKQFWTTMKVLNKKTLKQHYGLTLESFSNDQNEPFLKSTFSEGLGKDLATLVRRQSRFLWITHKHPSYAGWPNFQCIKRKKQEYLQKLWTFNCANKLVLKHTKPVKA